MKLLRKYLRGTPRLFAYLATLVLLAGGLGACSVAPPEVAPTAALIAPPPADPPTLYPARVPRFLQTGLASWYGKGFSRKPTASGERYDPKELTAAHRSLPLDTMVRVINLANGQMVMVRINDRGPFAPGRIIDLSQGAARRLGMTKSGVAPVRIEVFDTDQSQKLAEIPLP